MIIAVNYTNQFYCKAQKLNSTRFVQNGVDGVLSFSPKEIDAEFRNANRDILNAKRGNGYWLWKPYFISNVIRELREGDWLAYCDAGLYCHSDIKKYIAKISPKLESACFVVKQLKYKEFEYTKTDVLLHLGCNSETIIQSAQYCASVMLIKVCPLSLQVVEEWLEYAQIKHLITDSESFNPNISGFIENRHDQSILSVLLKKYKCAFSDDDLFHDIIKPHRLRKALFVYHHSSHGNVPRIVLCSTYRILHLCWKRCFPQRGERRV